MAGGICNASVRPSGVLSCKRGVAYKFVLFPHASHPLQRTCSDTCLWYVKTAYPNTVKLVPRTLCRGFSRDREEEWGST